MARCDLSVVIPAYNERDRLPPFLVQIREFFDHAGFDYNVIVVDDGSTDGSTDWLEEVSSNWKQLTVVTLPCNSGKGAAVRTGVLSANGKVILVTDADGATPISEVTHLLALIESGHDIACGSRLAGEKTRRSGLRRVSGIIFSWAVWVCSGVPIRDTQCGFKIFCGDVAQQLFGLSQENGFLFDVEILLLAHLQGFRLGETQVEWTEIPGSKVRLVRDGIRMLHQLFGLRSRAIRLLAICPRMCYSQSHRDELASIAPNVLSTSGPPEL